MVVFSSVVVAGMAVNGGDRAIEALGTGSGDDVTT
jgi:hypothetical protein